VRLQLQPTDFGKTYTGPARLTLYKGSNPKTPVVKVMDVKL
jgi:hypothetical protein